MSKKYGLHKRTKAGIWHYAFTIRHIRYRGSTGTIDYNLAEQCAHKTFNDLYLEKHEIKAPGPKSIKVNEYLQDYLRAKQYEVSRHWVYSSERTLVEFLDFLAPHNVQYLHEITLQILEQYKVSQLQKVKKITVLNKLKVLKTFLGQAVRLEIIKDNPVRRLTKINGIQKNKIRFFSKEEIEKIVNAFSNPQFKRFIYLKDLVTVGLYTGMRRGELINLEFQDVNFERRQIHIKNRDGFTTKSYKERIVPLHESLIPFFSQGKEGLCFSHQRKRINEKTTTKNFGIMLARLGINGDAGLHTLRHTFASYLIMSGVPIRIVAEYLGHATTHVTELYSHLCPQHFSGEIQKLNF